MVLIVACKSDDNDDDTTNLLYFLVLDQTSGNCARVERSTTADTDDGSKVKPLYTAYGNLVPKGGCNWKTLGSTYYNDSEKAATAIQSKFDEYITIAGNYSNCSNIKTNLESIKNGATSDNILKSVTSTGCNQSYTKQRVTFCYTRNDEVYIQNRTQYLPISSVASTMKTNITYRKAKLKNSQSSNGFSNTQISNLRAFSSEELSTYSSVEYYVTNFAFDFGTNLGTDTLGSDVYSYEACTKDLVNAYSDVKKLLVAQNGVNSVLGTTQTDVDSITDTLTYEPTCKYGSLFDESDTTSNQENVGGVDYTINGTCSLKEF